MKGPKVSVIIILSVLLSSFVSAQSLDIIGDKILNKEQAKEEYRLAYESLVNYHPYPNMYISETDFQKYYQDEMGLIGDQVTHRDMVIKIRTLVAEMKCGHTLAAPSPEWYQHVRKQKMILPFSLKQIGDKIFIKNTIKGEFEFQIDDEVLAINNKPIDNILSDMSGFKHRDGNEKAFVRATVMKYFPTYFILLYGAQSENEIKIKSKEGDESMVKFELTNKGLKKQAELQPTFELSTLEETKWSRFAVNSESKLGYLKIRSFSNRKEFKDFYKSVFGEIQKLNIESLILDLRDNGGGFFGHGNGLLTYLDEEAFTYNFHRPKKRFVKNRYTKLIFWNKLTRFAFNMKPGKNKIKGQKSYSFKYKPNKLVFKDDLHVIVNGLSFSQASLVAAQLHQKGVVFYGTTSGGTESGTNAVLSHKLSLPHSGIEALIPFYRIVSNSPNENFGKGITPDYIIEPTEYEISDTVLDEVIKLVLKIN